MSRSDNWLPWLLVGELTFHFYPEEARYTGKDMNTYQHCTSRVKGIHLHSKSMWSKLGANARAATWT